MEYILEKDLSIFHTKITNVIYFRKCPDWAIFNSKEPNELTNSIANDCY